MANVIEQSSEHQNKQFLGICELGDDGDDNKDDDDDGEYDISFDNVDNGNDDDSNMVSRQQQPWR